MNYQIAIVGPEAVVAGFGALGVKVFSVENAAEALETMRRLADPDKSEEEGRYAVVMVVESLLKKIPPKDYARFAKLSLPAIVAVPTGKDGGAWSERRLRDLIIKAVGTDL